MAQQQGLLTVTGYVGANPVQFNREGMPHASSFRLASTRRYFDNRTQQWRDLPTTWITVKAYRGLSENICQSLKKGEPVLVSGTLATEMWADQNGKQQSRVVLEASAVGHDLNYGVSTLRKVLKQNNEPKPAPAQTPHTGADPYARQNAGPVEVLDGNGPSSEQREPSAENGEPEGWNVPAETGRTDEKAAETRKDGEFDGQEF